MRLINTLLKDEFLHFPSEATIRRNIEENLEKYKLPNFGWTVDCVPMIFEEKPRKIPPGVAPKDFHNRKLR